MSEKSNVEKLREDQLADAIRRVDEAEGLLPIFQRRVAELESRLQAKERELALAADRETLRALVERYRREHDEAWAHLPDYWNIEGGCGCGICAEVRLLLKPVLSAVA